MQKLTGHITELLKDHDCVIIPQFGGFVANYRPASYLENKALFIPPGKEITFNPRLTHNDGLLMQQFMKAYGISYDEAGDLIIQELNELKSKLNTESVKVEGIGNLQKNADDYIEFIQNDFNKLLKSSYGFSGFHFNKLQAGEERKLKVIHNNTRVKRSNISKFSAAVAAAIIIMFFLFPLKVSNPDQSQAGIVDAFDSLFETHTPREEAHDLESQNNMEDVFIAAIPETESAETESNNAVNVQVNEPIKEEPAKVVMMPEAQYHIIVASLGSREQAIIFVERHCKNQFPDYQIIESNGRYRVSIEMFKDKSVAVPVLETFRDTNPDFSDAWLLTIKATV